MRNKFTLTVALVAVLAAFSTQVLAQSLISGDIGGVVADPSGAVVPAATVNLKNLDTGATQTTTTNASGEYRFALLKPGRYQVSVAHTGFQRIVREVQVAVGQLAVANLSLAVGRTTETIEVTAAAPIVNTEPTQSTAFNQQVVQNVPNPGGDLTNVALMAPGVTMNTSAGYGNFTANGLPATANVFTVNGENDMDPFFNINNSGATNLTLGLNEVQEASVITNPYSGEYGQLAGAQVTYITKSGTNSFHGSAKYMWNGRLLNANDWFANHDGTPRPFANNNTWGADFGGPIRKDKTFFYVNTEGLRYVLPTVQNTFVPSSQLAAASLAFLNANDPAAVPLATKLYDLWTNPATLGGRALSPVAGACGDILNYDANGNPISSNLPGININTPCVNNFVAIPTALSNEWILSARVDQNFGDKDKAFLRFRRDDGNQASYTDPINPAFNATSSQPSYDAQLQWSHIFSGKTTNQFLSALSWYTAIFQNNESLAVQTFPIGFRFSGVQLTDFGRLRSWPQGRNITQYQFVDDFSHIVGNHNFKFGANFRRYDTSDFDFFYQQPDLTNFGSMLELFTDAQLGPGGQTQRFRRWFNNTGGSGMPISMYGLGLYTQDEWRATRSLKLTLALRAEHNGNPVCHKNCFSILKQAFDSTTTGNNVAYNSVIAAGRNQAFPSTSEVNWSPRIGFTWNVFGREKTLLSGGIGLFYDSLTQLGLAELAFQNLPGVYVANVYDLPFLDGATPPATTSGSSAELSNTLLIQNYSSGASFSSLHTLSPTFTRPSITNFVGPMKSPQYQEWNLQLQQQIGASMALTLNYVGNHGIHIPVTNYPNAYDPLGFVATLSPTRPNADFATVTETATRGVSNYNGLSVSFGKRMSHGFSFLANYTWAHALDEVSNGGAFVYGNDSFLGQLNPLCLRCNNYGNADYDIRHNFSADFLWNTPALKGSKVLSNTLGGWTFSGTVFARTGLPFTVQDGNTVLGNYAFGSLPGQPLNPGIATFGQTGNCSNGNSQCLNASDFANTAAAAFSGYPTFPSQTRNQYRGPNLFDINMSVMKNFKPTERMTFGVGANFYNLLNHPNFANPDWVLGDSTFGQILSSAAAPASPYGSFVGAAAAPRLVQLQAKISF